MTVKNRILGGAINTLKGIINLLGRSKATYIMARIAEELVPTVEVQTRFGPITFFCPGEVPEWRARTLLSKEPETVRWIDSFNTQDTFWDIGANVGVYSLYAGLRGVRVLAFEPSPGNYYVLNKNVEINTLDSVLSAYNIAFNDETLLHTFFMQDTSLGSALNSFGEGAIQGGPSATEIFKQAMIGFSVDDFVEQFSPSFPNHIKIDVDGNEGKILVGAHKTLSDLRLKSILVELDTAHEKYGQTIALLLSYGMKLSCKGKPPEISNELSSVCNHIFARSEKD